MRLKSKSIMVILYIIFFASSFMVYFIPTGAQEEETDTEFEGILTCENEDIVTDSQWQWFKLLVDLKEEITINLEYSGDLDLDLYAYWGRENEPADFNGYDLTHCPRESNGKEIYKVAEYSQFRTTDTKKLGNPEEIVLKNPSYRDEEGQDAYILIVVYSGEGESEYTITANDDMTKINNDDVYDCNFILIVLITYITVAVAIWVLSIILIKRKKKKILKPPKVKKPKEEEQKDKVIDLNTQI